MTQHHPNMSLLTEYAAGSLCAAHSLCVSSHLEHCHSCRTTIAQCTEIGANLFDDIEHTLEQTTEFTAAQVAADHVSLNRLLDTINALEKTKPLEISLNRTDRQKTKPISAVNSTQNQDLQKLGAFVAKLTADDSSFKWERISKGLEIGRLRFDDNLREVSLQKLSPNAKVGHHDHKGNEITVVLKGSFSDQNGVYLPGDFLFKTPGNEHRPIASSDGDCICLTVADAPVKFRGLHSVLNPFLKHRPRVT